MPSDDLLVVCDAFVKLQQLRHQADYHPEWAVNLVEVETYRDEAHKGLEAWARIQETDEPIIFLFAALGVLTFR